MNQERIINRFIELCRIPSPSRKERDTADYCAKVLSDLGGEVEEDAAGRAIGGNAGNLIARFEGTNGAIPPVMLNAHMDTVDPGGTIVPRVRNGRIESQGDTILGADNRAGLTMILEGMRLIREQKVPTGNIEVVFTVGEEMGLEGAANLDKSLIQSRHGFSLDSSGLGRIVQGAPFYNAIDIRIQGRRAHAAVNADQGINSIELMARGLSRLPFGRLDKESTSNVGRISGGISRNVVAPDCCSVLEIRSHSEAKLDFYTACVSRTFLEVCGNRMVEVGSRCFRAVPEVTVRRECDGFFLNADSVVIQTAAEALKAIGKKPDLYRNMGGSDANVFNARDLETVVVGTGQKAVHSTEEYIEINDLIDGARLIPHVIHRWTEWWSQIKT